MSEVGNHIEKLEGHIPKAGKLADVMTWARRHGKPFTLTMSKPHLNLQRHQIRICLERLTDKGYLKRKKMPMSRKFGAKGSAVVPMWVYFPTKMLMDEPL